jgi:hypothetical protein
MEKNVKEMLDDAKQQAKNLLSKSRFMSALLVSYPDAVTTVAENGKTVYVSKVITSESKNVKTEFVVDSFSKRFYLKYFVLLGKTKVYSPASIPVDTSKVIEILNKFAAWPSSSTFMENLSK